MHEELAREDELSAGSERAFGIVFCTVFLIIGFWPLFSAESLRWWAIVIALAFLLVALVRPSWLKPLNRIWFKFGLLLHKVVNPIIMGIMFFVVLTPTALLLRMRGKDLLRLRREPDSQSYWIMREPPGPAPDTLKKQF